MQPNEYQELTKKTEIYSKASESFVLGIFTAKDVGSRSIKNAEFLCSLMYCAGKLNGEAGEVAELVFKALRDGSNGSFIIDDERRDLILKELGDILWYVARLADLLEEDLENIMIDNIDKLMSRKDRGVLSGSGDNR